MKQDVSSFIRDAIKRLRISQGLTQTQLAVKAGISPTIISNIECGHLKYPRITTLLKIADALEVSVNLFFEPSFDAA